MMIALSASKTVTGTIGATAQTLIDFGFTQAEIDLADVALVTPSKNIRFRFDGDAPIAALGHYIAENENLELRGNDNLNAVSLIRVAEDAATIITLGRF